MKNTNNESARKVHNGQCEYSKAEHKFIAVTKFGMWCWRRMEKISWTDRVRNEEVLLQVNEQRNILHTVKRRTANWLGHTLSRNCLLKHIIEGKIDVKGR